MTCKVCGEVGHNNRTCVANKDEGTKSRCKLCRGLGHNTRTCPVNAAGGTASKCNNCSVEGHNAVTCEAPCNCGNDGPEIPTHLPRVCPYGRKRKRVAEDGLPPAPGSRVCSACGKEGHKKDNSKFHPMPEGTPGKKKHDERACTLCGLVGHTKRSATFHPPPGGVRRPRRSQPPKADGEEEEEEEGGEGESSMDEDAAAAPPLADPAAAAAEGAAHPSAKEELLKPHPADAPDAAALAAPLAVVAAAAAPLPHAKRVLSCRSCGQAGHTARNARFHPKASQDGAAEASPASAVGGKAFGMVGDAEELWPMRAAGGVDDDATYAV